MQATYTVQGLLKRCSRRSGVPILQHCWPVYTQCSQLYPAAERFRREFSPTVIEPFLKNCSEVQLFGPRTHKLFLKKAVRRRDRRGKIWQTQFATLPRHFSQTISDSGGGGDKVGMKTYARIACVRETTPSSSPTFPKWRLPSVRKKAAIVTAIAFAFAQYLDLHYTSTIQLILFNRRLGTFHVIPLLLLLLPN